MDPRDKPGDDGVKEVSSKKRSVNPVASRERELVPASI
jgi:hypothetical protein